MTTGTTPDSTTWQDPAAVRFMLDDCATWAVVGLSGDPSRTAYSIASLLQSRGKRIVPIHPSAADGALTVLGEQAYPSLADVPFPRWAPGGCGSSSAWSTRRRSRGRSPQAYPW